MLFSTNIRSQRDGKTVKSSPLGPSGLQLVTWAHQQNHDFALALHGGCMYNVAQKGAILMTAKTANITIRMDAGLKQEAEELFADFGMNLTTAFNVFIRQSLRKQRIPFDITRYVPESDMSDAFAEAKRIAHDPRVKGYKTMRELKKSLQS
jgi:DNA-damage-inducible protein J